MIRKLLFFLTQFRLGYRKRDKFVIFLYSIFYLSISFLNKILGLVRFEVNPSMFDPTFMIKTKDGLYECRGRESFMMSGLFESAIRSHFKNFNKGTFVDIGTYIGKYTVMVANQLGRNGVVVSIEPIVENFERLKKNVNLNKLYNVLPINCACSDANGTENIYFHKNDFGLFSLSAKSDKYIQVKTKKLDSIFEELNIKTAGLIKIDVEDAEYKVFKGMTNTLKNMKPLIIFESRSMESVNLCRNILKRYGYKMKQLDKRHWLASKETV